MNIEYLHADTDAMKNDCVEMRNMKNDLIKDFETLFDDLEVIDGMWEGSAKEAFVARMAEDKSVCFEFTDMLEMYIQQMESAYKEYEKCENDLSEYISNLNI